MSTSTASLPGTGSSLFDAASRFCSAIFTAPKARPEEATLSTAARLWNLYLKSAGMNSVNPALFADRIVQD